MLDVFANEIAQDCEEWIAEAEQECQHQQSDEPYFPIIESHVKEYLERAYECGWHDACSAAIETCNKRATCRDDWGTTRSNEAVKCGLQIELALVTNRSEADGGTDCCGVVDRLFSAAPGLLRACKAVLASMQSTDLQGAVLWIEPPYQAEGVHQSAEELLMEVIELAEKGLDHGNND